VESCTPAKAGAQTGSDEEPPFKLKTSGLPLKLQPAPGPLPPQGNRQAWNLVLLRRQEPRQAPMRSLPFRPKTSGLPLKLQPAPGPLPPQGHTQACNFVLLRRQEPSQAPMWSLPFKLEPSGLPLKLQPAPGPLLRRRTRSDFPLLSKSRHKSGQAGRRPRPDPGELNRSDVVTGFTRVSQPDRRRRRSSHQPVGPFHLLGPSARCGGSTQGNSDASRIDRNSYSARIGRPWNFSPTDLPS